MERRIALAALTAAALGLVSCAAPPDRPPAPAEGGLDIQWSIDEETRVPREGNLTLLQFRITNTSEDVIVLRTLRYLAKAAEDSAPAATWQFARSGRLTYEPERNQWRYERRGKGRRAPVFNSGLIVPKETVVVRTTIRLLHLPKTYHLLYFRLTPEELRQKVYWEVRNERGLRYATLFGDDLRDRLWARDGEGKAGHRVVVFPHAEIVDTARGGAHLRLIRVDRKLEGRPYTLDRAIADSGGGRPDNYTFSEALDGWILSGPRGTTLVTAQGVRPLPPIRRLEPFFFYLDRVGVGKVEIELRDETKSLFAGQYPLVADPAQGRVYLFLQALDLLPFLEEARKFKLAMDVEFTSKGGGRVVVTNR